MDNLLDELDKRILRQLELDASISNQRLAEKVHCSAPTCLRRVKRLKDLGIIRAIRADIAPQALGYSIEAILEISLDIQGAEYLQVFEQQLLPLAQVQRCDRIASGPDFMVLIRVASMQDYHQFVQRYLTAKANVRNVRTFFSTYRAK